MTLAELTPLWAADGTGILAALAVDSPLWPRGREVQRSFDEQWSVADDEGEASMMIALRVPAAVGGKYQVEADEGVEPLPLQDRHLTLVYLGKLPKEERQRVHQATRRWLAEGDWPMLEGGPSGWGTFSPTESSDGKTVLWMGWSIPGVAEMREDLVQTLREQGFSVPDEFGFNLHETVAYVDGDLTTIPTFPDETPEHVFPGVVVTDGGRWTEYDFPMAMALREGATVSLVAALEQARDPELEALSDAELDALVAAGGLDRNRGNAERLRRYWTVGPGGAKIAWGTPGDWTRCVAFLSKHLGPRAKGYCQLRHKEMTRLYTGSRTHRIIHGWGGKPGSYWARRKALGVDEDVANGTLTSDRTNHTEAVLTAAGDETMDETNPLVMLMGGKVKPMRFRIPLLLPEGVESGDGRTFVKEVVDFRDLPLPLLWQPNSMQGHDGAVIVGRMDSMERTEDGIGNVVGVFDTSPVAAEAVRLIKGGFLRGVSADLDKFEAKIKGKGPGTSTAETDEDDEDETVAADKMDITQGRIMAATLVAKPAFQEARIELLDPEPDEIADGLYQGEIDPAMRELAEEFARMVTEGDLVTLSNNHTLSLVASGMQTIPVDPPEAWFADPGLTRPTHLTITDDGRVYGHIAAWSVDHIGMGFGTRPPRSRTNYAYFRTGLLRTAEGTDVRVGQITLVGGHASLSEDARGAVRHYDDTKSAFADVAAGEDAHGIWVSGALRPDVTAAQLRAIRAASPSGDWRPINGRLELVAICQVNVPGFPVVEARVASGQVLALVAAGTAPLLADMLGEQGDYADLSVLAAQAKATVMAPLVAQAAQAKATVMAPLAAQALAAQAAMAKYRLFRQNVSDERRERLTEKGHALPGGRFPIGNVADLRRAIQAYGRAREEDRAKVRRHIMKRARALGRPDLIPEGWAEAAAAEHPSTFEPLPFTPSKAGLLALDPAEPINPEALTAAATLGRPDLLPAEWDQAFADATGIPAALVASIRSVRRKAWDEAKVSRDDIGRFRKIYYRLRQSPASAKPEIRAALRAIKEAERVAEVEGATDQESTELARQLIEEAAASSEVDERTQVDLIEAASEMADLMRRFEVRGEETFMSFDQLPTEIQAALERYMTTGAPKEERIEKHFGPFISGETNRSIKDILNFIEKVIVDAQGYEKGLYDKQRV